MIKQTNTLLVNKEGDLTFEILSSPVPKEQ